MTLLPDVLLHQRVRLPFELLNVPFSGIFRAPTTEMPHSLACEATRKLLHSIKTAKSLSIVTFMNTSRFVNEKEMQMPTLKTQLSQRINSSVKPFWATQAPANRLTSPAAWLTEVRDCRGSGMTTKKSQPWGLK